MARTGGRTIPPSTAALVEELELDPPRIVTAAMLGDLAAATGITLDAPRIAERLQRHGWLLPLRTRGAWEFAPAARAGAIGSGDRLIELRALLAVKPDLRLELALAFDSAAYLLGLVTRIPGKDVVATKRRLERPASVDTYRWVNLSWRVPAEDRDGLPCWPPPTLFVGLAHRPTELGDWANASEWLGTLTGRVKPDDVLLELADRPAATWARAGYLANVAGAKDLADEIAVGRPRQAAGPFYLGRRDRPGRHNARFDVIDTVGLATAPVAPPP